MTKCSHGKAGDQLWVREAWRTLKEADKLPPRDLNAAHRIWFEADNDHQEGSGKLRPSMFMPRLASRITLEITSVRVERLQDISEADATAEGTPHSLKHPAGRTAIENYEHLWECLNGDDSWDLNPWVWVIEFKKVKP